MGAGKEKRKVVMSNAEELKRKVLERTGLKPNELVCPREKTTMTPCVVRDGDLATTGDGKCVGCGVEVLRLLTKEE